MSLTNKRARAGPEPTDLETLDMSADELMQWFAGSKDDDPNGGGGAASSSGGRVPSRATGDDAASQAERAELAFISGFLADGVAQDGSSASGTPPCRGEDRPPSAPARGVSEHEVNTLVGSLPTQYAVSTSRADQEMHVRLLRSVRSGGAPAVTQWVRSRMLSGETTLQLHIVFRDR
jgi:hypothetical protein